MAFAQLDVPRKLARYRSVSGGWSKHAYQLYHMGIGAAVARSTLADADESRELAHLHFELAQRLIIKARALYVDEDFGVRTGSYPCMPSMPRPSICACRCSRRAPFRSTKAAVKLRTLLDLRGSIPTFVHISDGKMHDVDVLDLLLIEAGAFYIMDRGYLDFERLYALDQVEASSSPAPSETAMHGACIRRRWIATRIDLRPDHRP